MERREFIKMCTLLGIGVPMLQSCDFTTTTPLKKTDKVIIIGAGAAGLTAAYLLNQQEIKVEILEAAPHYGGRMKRTTTFADFPIPTGAEWLHTERTILNSIVNNQSVSIKTQTKPYNPKKNYALIDGKKEPLKKLGFTIDQKFINATWYDFYEQYIVPRIKNNIHYKAIVTAIDYSRQKIIVKTTNKEFKADRVIITVPVKVLQTNTIKFTPELPVEKAKAIKKVKVWGGCKAFIAFKEKFYPAATGFTNIPEEQGHKLFYDAAYAQNTQQHILGLFAVGPVSKPYTQKKGEPLIKHILNELDRVYNQKATPNYQKHIFQNWTNEPFIKSAYVHYFESWQTIRQLGKPVQDKIFFAGDAYTDGTEWSSVHAAAKAAKRVVAQLLGH